MIKSFLPPFLVAFSIAVFVLLMQILWVWLDDIVGKGAGILVIAEMVGYMSISMFPMALPIGVLLSSVMVMGNLSEKYELVSFKSAGVSLSRVMMPLIICCTLISVFSFVCANSLIPYANLKFRSRLYDIKKKKPTLSLQEGVFNSDFQGYVMHIKEKDSDTGSMDDVVIYDQRGGHRGEINQIISTGGTIRPTRDNQFLVMHLDDGTHYQEAKSSNYKKNYPFVRTSFKSWEKVFDLREFDLSRTNEDLFKSNEGMMSGAQIREALDSLVVLERERKFSVEKIVADYYPIYEGLNIIQDSSLVQIDSAKIKELAKKSKTIRIDSLPKFKSPIEQIEAEQKGLIVRKVEELDHKDFYYQAEFDSLRLYKKKSILQTVKTRLTTLTGRMTNRGRSLSHTIESKTKHIYQLHLKYSNALVCLIFLFIGAPMGAIVRKGGFGYPVLIAILFFMIYIILTLTFKKLIYSYVVLPVIGAWMPCLLMIPFGLVLTHRALNDKKIGDISQYTVKIKTFVQKIVARRKAKASENIG